MSYSLGDFFSPDLVVWVESGEEASLEAGVGAIIEVAIKITMEEQQNALGFHWTVIVGGSSRRQ